MPWPLALAWSRAHQARLLGDAISATELALRVLTALVLTDACRAPWRAELEAFARSRLVKSWVIGTGVEFLRELVEAHAQVEDPLLEGVSDWWDEVSGSINALPEFRNKEHGHREVPSGEDEDRQKAAKLAMALGRILRAAPFLQSSQLIHVEGRIDHARARAHAKIRRLAGLAPHDDVNCGVETQWRPKDFDLSSGVVYLGSEDGLRWSASPFFLVKSGGTSTAGTARVAVFDGVGKGGGLRFLHPMTGAHSEDELRDGEGNEHGWGAFLDDRVALARSLVQQMPSPHEGFVFVRPADLTDGLRPGQEIQGMRLVQPLGRGGSAVVWEVVDVHDGSPYALKVLDRAAASDAEQVVRFESEIATTKRLWRAGCGRVIGPVEAFRVATAAGERLVLRMPACRQTLKDAASEWRAAGSGADEGLDRVVGWFTEALEALAQVHGHGVVHRDVKPSNFLLDMEGQLRLADLGIARLAEPAAAGPTRTSQKLGSDAYMAPEQRLDPRSVTGAADIYALAITVDELIHGAPRSTPGKDVAGALGALLTRMGQQDAALRPTAAEALAEVLAWGAPKPVAEATDSMAPTTDDQAWFETYERDPFETHEEHAARVDELPAVAFGVVTPHRKRYEMERSILPVTVRWSRAVPGAEVVETDRVWRVDRVLAREVCPREGLEFPVVVLLGAERGQVSVARVLVRTPRGDFPLLTLGELVAEERRAEEAAREATARREAEEAARREAEEAARREAEEKAKREAEEKARREAEEAAAKRAAEERAKREAEEEAAKRAAEEKAEREAEEKAKRDGEEEAAKRAAKLKAEREAEEEAKREAKAKARHETEVAAKRAAKEKVERAADEKAKREAEAKARREAEDAAKREADEAAKRVAEAKARREAEMKARREAEEKAKREAEAKARREAEAKARHEGEAKARREAEAKARYEAEAKARREAEEAAKRAADEKARREAEETAKREAEALAKREAAARARWEAGAKAQREAEEKAKRAAERRALQGPTIGDLERAVAELTDAPAAAALRPGSTLGPYTVLKPLTVGLTSEIHLAKTVGADGFEKLVALKVIPPGRAEEANVIEGLTAEATLGVQLSHANIRQTFDLGRIDRTYFVALEFVDGRDLHQLLVKCSEKDISIPLDVATFIGTEMSAGLHAAHTKADNRGAPLNALHRNVSPGNVLVSFDGEVKLIDFDGGRAGPIMGGGGGATLLGVPSYFSPEQVSNQKLDCRTDVFSTGICLYEMITGEMLYHEEKAAALLEKLRKAEIPNMRLRRRGLPPPLEQILLKALARDRTQRHSSAGELNAALSGFLRHTWPNFNRTRVVEFMRHVFGDQRFVLPKTAATQPSPSAPRAPAVSPAPSGLAVRFDICHVNQPAKTRVIAKQQIRIGNLASSDLRLDDDDVSGVQAVIEVDAPDRVVLLDLGSQTGTRLNGEKISRQSIVSGDVLGIGGFWVVVTIGTSREVEQSSRVIAALERAVALVPQATEIHKFLASTYVGAGRSERAADYLRVVAEARLAAGDVGAAMHLAEQLEEVAPLELANTRVVVMSYLGGGHAARAAHLCMRALPDDVVMLERVAGSLDAEKDRDLGVEVLHQLAEAQARRGAAEARLKTLRAVLAVSPNDSKALDAIQAANVPKVDRPTPSKPNAQLVTDASLAITRGNAALAAGNLHAALVAFLDANSTQPTPALLKNIAAIHESLGNRVVAIKYYTLYLQSNPPDAEAIRPGLERLRQTSPATAPHAAASTATVARPPAKPPEGFVLVRSGQHTLQDEGRRARRVTLTRGLWVKATPVTQDEYRRVVPGPLSALNSDGGDAPVVGVSWQGAVDYCNWLSDLNRLERCYGRNDNFLGLHRTGYRLPTEAEWEIAARAGTFTETPIRPVDDVAWHAGNSGGWLRGRRCQRVGQKAANDWGLDDMLGNVWEWTNDWLGRSLEPKEETDPTGPAAGNLRVLRGGSFETPEAEIAYHLRIGRDPTTRAASIGFRPVRTA